MESASTKSILALAGAGLALCSMLTVHKAKAVVEGKVCSQCKTCCGSDGETSSCCAQTMRATCEVGCALPCLTAVVFSAHMHSRSRLTDDLAPYFAAATLAKSATHYMDPNTGETVSTWYIYT